MIKIRDTEIIKCPRCGSKHILAEWENTTYGQCTSREMKRAYISLSVDRAYKEKSNTFYMCPRCNQWSRGSQLIIESDDIELVKLGRKPIIRYTNK